MNDEDDRVYAAADGRDDARAGRAPRNDLTAGTGEYAAYHHAYMQEKRLRPAFIDCTRDRAATLNERIGTLIGWVREDREYGDYAMASDCWAMIECLENEIFRERQIHRQEIFYEEQPSWMM